MSNISFGGLASGLDTSSLIQQLLSIESRPITLLSRQRATLLSQSDAYKDLNTRFNGLKNAAFELTKISSLVGRKANSSDTDTLVTTANANASSGAYEVEILRLATATRLKTGSATGQGNDLGGVADNTDFSAEQVVQLNLNHRLKEDLTAGNFYVNNQEVTVSNTDTLSDIFNKINTATGGSVTGQLALDSSKGGRVAELSSSSPITLSAGSSNFLSVFNLDTAAYDSGSQTLVSSEAVNRIRSDLQLDNSAGATNLAQPLSGSGVLTINNTAIAYNTSEDSLNDIIERINNSAAGVRATFAAAGAGQLSLVAQNNGPQAIQVADTGNLANALGLLASNSQTLGQSSQIRVDGGAVQSFNKNTGITAAGLDGVLLDLRSADPGNPVTVTVDVDTEAATEKVDQFVNQFNQVVGQINNLTSFNASSGQKGLLLSDFTVTGVRQRLFEMVFSQVSGLDSGNFSGSLAELGFSSGAIGSAPGTTGTLQVDTGKLSQALQNDPTRVAQIFGAEPTSSGAPGVMQKLKDYLDGLSNAAGVFTQRQKSTANRIEDIDERIDSLNARLSKRQIQLENQFTALEKTISRLQTQQNSLSALFASN